MKTDHLRLLLGLVVMLGAITFAPAAAPVPVSTNGGEKLYVVIDYFITNADELRFDRVRYSPLTGDEVILSTLKSTAEKQAQAVGYDGEVVVLDEGAATPAGAPVLRLTWGVAAGVTVELLHEGKTTYLGVAGRMPLSAHPDAYNMRLRLDQSQMRDAYRDAALRVGTEMDLFAALHFYVAYRQKTAKA